MMEKLRKQFELFEKAKSHVFHDNNNEPKLYSHERQEYSGLDIDTYLYIADHYDELKKKLK